MTRAYEQVREAEQSIVQNRTDLENMENKEEEIHIEIVHQQMESQNFGRVCPLHAIKVLF